MPNTCLNRLEHDHVYAYLPRSEATDESCRLSGLIIAGRGFEPHPPHQLVRPSANSARQVCASKTSTSHRAIPLRLIRASAVINGTRRASAKGDVLRGVRGQVGMKALQARPQGQHVLPFDGERAVAGERGVGFSFRDFLSAREPEKR